MGTTLARPTKLAIIIKNKAHKKHKKPFMCVILKLMGPDYLHVIFMAGFYDRHL